MIVVRAKSAGFCWGVRRAVRAAEDLAATGGAPIFTDGPLIHNTHEVERLAALGVRPADDPAALPAGSRLLVRAHGIPPERESWLRSLGLEVTDATCPNVAGIQKRCAEAAAEGRTVLILGDPGHAEVVGLLGHAAGRGRVVTGPRDVESLPDPGSAVTLVSQTTQGEAVFDETARAVLRRWPEARIEKTICGATRQRQGELTELASRCDAFVVVGSKASANTQRLHSLAAALRPAFVVDSPDDLREDDFGSFRTVALTAGASTPDSLIEAVEARLRSFG